MAKEPDQLKKGVNKFCTTHFVGSFSWNSEGNGKKKPVVQYLQKRIVGNNYDISGLAFTFADSLGRY